MSASTETPKTDGDVVTDTAADVPERHYYRSIIDELLKDNEKTLAEAIAAAISSSSSSSSSSLSATAIKFHHQRLTDLIVHDLLLGMNRNSKDDNCHADNVAVGSTDLLGVIQRLVVTDEEMYLPAVALSLRSVIQKTNDTRKNERNTNNNVHVSTNLLQIWMYQMVHSNNCNARRYFTEALMAFLVISDSDDDDDVDDILDNSCTTLCQIWNQLNSSEDTRTGSVVSVRCVSVLVQMLVRTDVGGANNRLLSKSSHVVELTQLLASSIQNFDDPLQQMAVLDEITQHTGVISDDDVKETTTEIADRHRRSLSPQLQKFWSSPDLMGPILQMLHDPILASTALQYVTQLCVLENNSPYLSRVLDYVRDLGYPPPTAEKERLTLIHAVSNLVSQQSIKLGRTVINDSTVRCAWWGDLKLISNPKLQAAILMSIRSTLLDLLSRTKDCTAEYGDWSPSESRALAVDLYSKVGPDNDSSLTTTQWLLQGRFVSNSLAPEVRIATYSLLVVMIRIPIERDERTETTTTNPILGRDTLGRMKLLELLSSSSDDSRETSSDARNAYFDLLDAYVNNPVLMDEIDNDITRKKLRDKYAMGPHGRQPQRWDVATE